LRRDMPPFLWKTWTTLAHASDFASSCLDTAYRGILMVGQALDSRTHAAALLRTLADAADDPSVSTERLGLLAHLVGRHLADEAVAGTKPRTWTGKFVELGAPNSDPQIVQIIGPKHSN
jgi:hypothetical protein